MDKPNNKVNIVFKKESKRAVYYVEMVNKDGKNLYRPFWNPKFFSYLSCLLFLRLFSAGPRHVCRLSQLPLFFQKNYLNNTSCCGIGWSSNFDRCIYDIETAVKQDNRRKK